MLHFHSNMTLDELLKDVSHKNFNLYVELQKRIDQKIQTVYDKIESEQDEQENYSLHSIHAMEYFCSEDLKWIKDEQKKIIRYFVHGFDESSHYDNHNISI